MNITVGSREQLDNIVAPNPSRRRSNLYREFFKNPCKHYFRFTISASADRSRALAPFLKTPCAVTFRKLSQVAAVFLVLLVASPVTAPFASFDLAAGTTPVEEMLDGSSKVTAAVPVIVPFILRIEPVDAQGLHHAVFVVQQDDRSPRLTVLRV